MSVLLLILFSVFCIHYGEATMTPHVYVFGLESSGTRYISRGIAKSIDEKTHWGGESPACWKHKDGDIQHISLPWGGTCDGHEKRTKKEVNLCSFPHHHPPGRWFANITNVLNGFPDRKAVVIVRVSEFTLPSVMKHHCFKGKEIAIEEEKYGRQIIREALEKVPDQILLTHYESMYYFSEYEWKRIYTHFNIRDPKPHPDFLNGNPAWINSCKHGSYPSH